MQTPKTRSGSSETPQKISPRVVRQLNVTAPESKSGGSSLVVRQLNATALESKPGASSSQTLRTPKDRSPKVIERKSPRSPVSEKKRPSRISELESHISKLQEDLKKTKDQLNSSESCKNQALQDAEDSKKELLALTSKLEESQKQLLELSSAPEESGVLELQSVEAAQNRNLDSASAGDIIAESEGKETRLAESTILDIENLKKNLTKALSLVENMNNWSIENDEPKCGAHVLATETLMQLENAKRSVEALLSRDGKNLEVNQPKAQVNSESLVNEIETGVRSKENEENQNMRDSNGVEEEVSMLRSEIEQLRSALNISEAKFQEERIRYTKEIKSANELAEQMRSESSQKELELEAEAKSAKSKIEELKANMMDKETELQGISEENEDLRIKLQKKSKSQRESELENEIKKLKDVVENLKANLMDKETEFQNISEENETLKSRISQWETAKCQVSSNDVTASEIEAARAAERDALRKLGLAMEEADKSKKRAARVAEQLDAAQAANSETEGELRRLKVQSDQWRKAAEAAAAMLSAGNNNNGKFVERTGSLDSSYNAVGGKLSSPYTDDMDEDLMKKKNGNVLKKFGVLWRKPQK